MHKHLYYSLDIENSDDALVYAVHVSDPEKYGVLEFNDDTGDVEAIVEKPQAPKSNYIVTGLYRYPKGVSSVAKNLVVSKRGELEITDLNNYYVKAKKLICNKLSRGAVWFDVGDAKSLLDASNFVRQVEDKQGLKIACLEEIALRKGFIDLSAFDKLTDTYRGTPYHTYLKNVRNEFS